MFQSSFLISLKESKCNYSAVRLGFTQLTLQTAANKAKSSIRAKRPMSDDGKTPLQASLRRIFVIISRVDE